MVSFDEALSLAFPWLKDSDDWALHTALESEENYFFMLGQRFTSVGEDGAKRVDYLPVPGDSFTVVSKDVGTVRIANTFSIPPDVSGLPPTEDEIEIEAAKIVFNR